MITEKIYKSVSISIIGFAKVTSLEILTHLITEYADIEEEYIQDIDRKMKEPISGKTLFEEFVDQIEWNQEAVAVQNPYSPAQIVLMAYANIENADYIKTIVENGLVNQRSIKHGATSRITSIEPSRRPEDPQGPQRPKAMQQTHTPHKPMRHFSPRCSRTTPWHWRISQRLHKPIEHRSRCSRRRYQSYRYKSLPSPRNSRQQNPRTPG